MTKERDAAATRKISEPKLTQKEEKEAVQWSNALEEDGIGAIKKVSRQELDQVLANTMDGLITKVTFGSSTTKTKTMDGLITKVTFGSSTTKTKTKFATGEAKITGSQQLYCSVQCTPDITENACRDCLVYALDRLRHHTHGNE
ncbi:hypothetical protein TEA_029636 [Camellia sinensis var. sinensis]|uniref:Gnk2-homologous domain-containing protein n=1 Tax=Camellia sinensis var. sinensis TaxID=542762 RepID=A0A4S4DDB6_CAMSN|nr:hypothetical protein TEA_029636 [Camellia sinensis var. sinensis]